MAFDLTSTQEALHDIIHPELTNCTISVELKFDAPLGENVELLFMRERASTVYVRSDRKIAKNTLMSWLGEKIGQFTDYWAYSPMQAFETSVSRHFSR